MQTSPSIPKQKKCILMRIFVTYTLQPLFTRGPMESQETIASVSKIQYLNSFVRTTSYTRGLNNRSYLFNYIK